MNKFSVFSIFALMLSAGVVKSQAPASGTTVSSLQALVNANKALIETQKKTLDGLDLLDTNAQQLKIFGKRG